MSRIYNDKISLDKEEVRAFFERRGNSINPDHPLTSVLYQDQNPDLAHARDTFEKERVLPMLKLTTSARVLDVGCGIGRWADCLVGLVGHYHGIDFSTSLVAAARDRVGAQSVTFQELSAESVSRERLSVASDFSHVIIAGVLLYLNDNEALRTLAAVADVCGGSALIYIREPIAVGSRLTLKQFASSELQSNYNAIYRTEAEFLDMARQSLIKNGFHLTFSDDLYPHHLNNRPDTIQKLYIFERP